MIYYYKEVSGGLLQAQTLQNIKWHKSEKWDEGTKSSSMCTYKGRSFELKGQRRWSFNPYNEMMTIKIFQYLKLFTQSLYLSRFVCANYTIKLRAENLAFV